MNISDFTYILQNPVHVNEAQTEAIATVIKEFPYFQAARVVHLKGLKNQDSFQYNQHLRITAAYTTDRSILFDFITSKNFAQHGISNTVKESQNQTNEIEVVAEEVVVPQNLPIEEAIETKIQEANAILDPNLFLPKEEKEDVVIDFEIEGEIEDTTETSKEKIKDKKKRKKEKEKKKKKKDKEKKSVKNESTELKEEIVFPISTPETEETTETVKEVEIEAQKEEADEIVEETTIEIQEEVTEVTETIVADISEEVIEEVETVETETPEETLQLGKPLSFDKNEKHSFAEWLQLTKLTPIDRSEEVENIPEETSVSEEATATETAEITIAEETEKEEIQFGETNDSSEEKQKRFELIDKFIDTNPKITPKPTLEKNINLANSKNVDQSMLMTETLAKVYLEQKKYKKAITAYNILILKYPEKSSFFADQIQAIKKLQQNN